MEWYAYTNTCPQCGKVEEAHALRPTEDTADLCENCARFFEWCEFADDSSE